MQGSLWRGGPGTGVASQLTDGPGYHYQPDWSPTAARRLRGLRRRRGRAPRLDLGAAGRAADQRRAVNVEPRFSPDGTPRLRLHRSRGPVPPVRPHVSDGRPRGRAASARTGTAACRATTTAASIITVAHVVAGRTELLYVSNHGHSGAPAASGAPGGAGSQESRAPLRGDSWKARPDWARDGKRVVCQLLPRAGSGTSSG